MNAIWRNRWVAMLILIGLGIVAFLTGVKSLIILVPAALVIWYGGQAGLRSGRS